MFRRAIFVSLLVASVPVAAGTTLSFNFSGATGSAASYDYNANGLQGQLALTASAVKFFPAPELLAGTNISALTTAGTVSRSNGSTAANPAGLGVSGGGDTKQIDTNSPGTAQAPLREALLLTGDKRFSIHSLTLNMVDRNDTFLLFGIDSSGLLTRLGYGTNTGSVPQNPGTILGGLEGFATITNVTTFAIPNDQTPQNTVTFNIPETELYKRYLFTTRVGGDVLFGGDRGNGYQLLALAGALPEPGTWAMMIGGFGLAGASLRRQRKLATA
jgi:PEP-CTERM motif